MSWTDYAHLFDDLLPAIVHEHDPDRPYWPGSPHTPGRNRRHANDSSAGDVHDWQVWHGKLPFEHYLETRHRFISEFGFQSFPEPRTVYGYTLPADRNVTSRIMEYHQRSEVGNATILHYMLEWFQMPCTFEAMLWMSQIIQAVGIDLAIRHWRRNRPCTMGTIYWQLNDTWPVASWSSIDYHGRWKALHYLARRFYAPVMLSSVVVADQGLVEAHLTNDQRAPVSGELRCTVTDTNGKTLYREKCPARCPAGASRRIRTFKLKKLFPSRASREIMVWLEFATGRRIISTDLALFVRPKHLELSRRPRLAMRLERLDERRFLAVITTGKPALWCWLESTKSDLRFSDNFFHLRPGKSCRITIESEVPLTAQRLRGMLKLSNLSDTHR